MAYRQWLDKLAGKVQNPLPPFAARESTSTMSASRGEGADAGATSSGVGSRDPRRHKPRWEQGASHRVDLSWPSGAALVVRERDTFLSPGREPAFLIYTLARPLAPRCALRLAVYVGGRPLLTSGLARWAPRFLQVGKGLLCSTSTGVRDAVDQVLASSEKCGFPLAARSQGKKMPGKFYLYCLRSGVYKCKQKSKAGKGPSGGRRRPGRLLKTRECHNQPVVALQCMREVAVEITGGGGVAKVAWQAPCDANGDIKHLGPGAFDFEVACVATAAGAVSWPTQPAPLTTRLPHPNAPFHCAIGF